MLAVFFSGVVSAAGCQYRICQTKLTVPTGGSTVAAKGLGCNLARLKVAIPFHISGGAHT